VCAVFFNIMVQWHCFCIVVKALQLYVFDDTDPDESTYLGVAKIPLITLAHDKPIQGTFELTRVLCLQMFCFVYWIQPSGSTLFCMD